MLRILPKAILIALLFYSFIAFFSPTKAFATPPQECSTDKSYEIIPSCVVCGGTLFCYGTDYINCSTDPIPSGCQPEGSNEWSCSPNNFPSGTFQYNGETFTVPNWVYYCNDNVFGCANPACAGAAGAPSEIEVGFDSNNLAYGKDIEIPYLVSKDPKGNPNLGELANAEITVGPQTGINLRFPELSDLARFTFRALPFQLPKVLADVLSIPEVELQGAIFHPTCEVRVDGQRKGPGVGSGKEKAEVKTPTFWTKILGTTKIGQAVSVPGKSSSSVLIVKQPTLPGDEENEPLEFCPESPGRSAKIIETESQKQTTVSNIWEDILNLFKGIIDNFLALFQQKAEVIIVDKPKKFIPGEQTFEEQTSGALGMFKSICPQSLCQGPEEQNEKTKYIVNPPSTEGSSPEIGLEFKGVCGARAGANLLIQSLFPAGFGTAELEECK